jgi:hypothetical protein
MLLSLTLSNSTISHIILQRMQALQDSPSFACQRIPFPSAICPLKMVTDQSRCQELAQFCTQKVQVDTAHHLLVPCITISRYEFQNLPCILVDQESEKVLLDFLSYLRVDCSSHFDTFCFSHYSFLYIAHLV